MATPLYKSLKTNGTTIYAFPGAEEDINQIGDNYKLSFTKFSLLNLPKVQTALTNEPVTWDFENSFYGASPQPATNYADRTINSLRNYVANHEVTIRSTKISDTEYFYDNSVLQTNTEKIFFKWAKKMNLIQFEKATDGDEYFAGLDDFTSNNPNDNEYLREFLWKEREVSDNSLYIFYETATSHTNKLEVEYNGTINYKVGDWVEFTDVENVNFPVIVKYAEVLQVIVPSGSNGYRVVFDVTYTGSQQSETVGYSKLIYNRLVRYIGEIQGNNNVVSNNISYDQIMAFVADNAGETPDVLFRTKTDNNYGPDLRFPILPAQYQPEIIGAEHFNSPILKNPENYPGDQYAQYDNDDNLDSYDYLSKSGDELRRTGDYFGVTGDINNVVFDSDNLDGIQMDFNTSHYVKMNVFGDEITNFDEFNTRKVNGEFPSDFEFNAILWYYQVTDSKGNSATNLYGISFLDHPDNDQTNTGTQFPGLRKIAASDLQDGVAYQFSLNKHTTITTETPQPVFDNSYINNLFGMSLFNEAMRRLVVFNDSAMNIIAENEQIFTEINNLKQLVYTATSIETINTRIAQLNDLLQLYSTNQMVSTTSIRVEKDDTVSPPEIKLYNIEGRYYTLTSLDTINLYNDDGNIPKAAEVPEGKDFLVNLTNNDTITQELPDDQNLIVFLNRDLYYRQTVDFIIDGSIDSIENKQLDILITYDNGNNIPVLRKAVENLDLPVYYNVKFQDQNTAYNWNQVQQDLNSFKLNSDGETVGMSASRVSGLNKGDSILVENTYFGTGDSAIKVDGQYVIDSINGLTINVDYLQNDNLTSYINQEILAGNLSSGDIITDYSSMGIFRLNKGYKVSITRIDESNTSTFEDRYLILTSPLG
tara:strand:- start:5903 stop:8527 length:2625 start_codon:yes stop_codon:yes gene_type:complete